MKKGCLWMLFWELVFVLFVLPWAWLPIALELDLPEWAMWVGDQAFGNF